MSIGNQIARMCFDGFSVSVSTGVGEASREMEGPDAFVSYVDQQLYAAKRRVGIWSGMAETA